MPRIHAALLLLALASTATADELRTLAGKSVTGSLAAITDAEIVMKTDAGPVATPLSQVLAVDVRPVKGTPPAKFALVRLIDDSILRCTDLAFGAKDVTLTLSSGASAKLPLAAVASILRDAHDPALAKQWERFDRQNVRRDRVFILRDGELNPVEGALGDVDPQAQAVRFTREGAAAIALPLSRVAGLSFHRTEPPAEAPICRVVDQDGNTLAAARLAYADGTLTVTTPFGTAVPLKQEALAKLDFNLGRLTYLSDLDAKVIASPLLGGFNPVRRDANLDGNPIVLLDKQFAKGLSTYAGVELEYPLGGKYKDFKATLGADPRIAEEGQGKVTVTVYCDGEKRLSKDVSAAETVPIAVSVKDVNTLRIVVAGPNFTPFAGHATLADARVSQ